MGWRWSCVVIVVLLLLPFMASPRSSVKNLPGYKGDLPFKLETGYIGVGEAEEVQLFYLFVESQRTPSIDPLLLWFVGGPGCSGLSAFFFENGPLVMDRNYSGNLPKLELNPYAWTQVLNVIYIDIPVGTGFSYSETQEGYYSSDTQWVEHAYTFLQKWFIDHPKFGSNPFYIGGGSYSGLVTGPLVEKIYEGYIARRVPLMNIKGYVLASPGVDLYQDQNMKVLYAYHMSLISEELYESMKENCDGDYVSIDPENTKCVSDYEAYSELVRYINSQQILEPLCITTPGVNQGILQLVQDRSTFWCRSYDHILIDTWANDESVWKALHVREGTKEEFLRCNKSLAYTHQLFNVVQYYRNLSKANLQALVYCADLDMAVPHLSTQYWIKSLNLSIHDKWHAWFVDGQVAGFTEISKMKEDHYLTYVIVKGAGHVAQTFKPKEVYNMIDRGDVTPQDCRSCLNDSRVMLTRLCPNQKEPIGFYFTCMLRYSNRSIFGTIETSPWYYQWAGNNATMVDQFNGVVMKLLNTLSRRAASGDSLRKFAAGNDTGPNFQNIYALVQCTPDLSEQYCNDCLAGAISEIPKCCDGRRGVRIGRPSCNVRYENYRFYEAIADTIPPPEAPSNDITQIEGKSNNKLRTAITIVVSAAALLILVILICIYLKMKKPRKYSETEVEIEVEESLQFDFDTIRVATNNFSYENKLGEGGFGPVYKGKLSNGLEIAVKGYQELLIKELLSSRMKSC